jgi:hypothetical protein
LYFWPSLVSECASEKKSVKLQHGIEEVCGKLKNIGKNGQKLPLPAAHGKEFVNVSQPLSHN